MSAPDARGRVIWRVALAVVVVLDLLSFAAFLPAARAAAAGRGVGFDGYAAFVSQPFVSVALVAVGIVAAVAFALRAGRLWAGAVALGVLALLSSAHAQLFGSPWRHLFYSGLCLAGWLSGLSGSRLRGTPIDESYACTGAIALLGAAYCNAGIGKLVYGSRDWSRGPDPSR
jgi:hypothetical protein